MRRDARAGREQVIEVVVQSQKMKQRNQAVRPGCGRFLRVLGRFAVALFKAAYCNRFGYKSASWSAKLRWCPWFHGVLYSKAFPLFCVVRDSYGAGALAADPGGFLSLPSANLAVHRGLLSLATWPWHSAEL